MNEEEITYGLADDESSDDLKTTTIDDVEATPKRRRGRPRKNPVETVSSSEESTPAPKPTTRARRSKKLSGADVADGVEMLTTVIVMAGGEEYAHWQISANEFRPLADGYADLLNRIPTRYVKGAFDLSGYISLAVGTYSIVAPRIAATRAIKMMKRQKAQEETEPVTLWTVPNN